MCTETARTYLSTVRLTDPRLRYPSSTLQRGLKARCLPGPTRTKNYPPGSVPTLMHLSSKVEFPVSWWPTILGQLSRRLVGTNPSCIRPIRNWLISTARRSCSRGPRALGTKLGWSRPSRLAGRTRVGFLIQGCVLQFTLPHFLAELPFFQSGHFVTPCEINEFRSFRRMGLPTFVTMCVLELL